MNRLIPLLLALLAAVGLALPAAAQTFPERGTAPVVDAANIIDAETEARLTQQLDQFEETDQRQFVIVTVPDLEGYDIADYGYRLGREWGIGDAERNDGILLIVAPNEKRMRIEVGYGLEGVIPDGLAFEYVEGMKPYFRAGDFSGGIEWAAGEIMAQLRLPPEEAAKVAQQAGERRESDGGFPVGGFIWLAFILFFFILPLMRRGKRRRYRKGDRMGQAVGDIILWEVGSAVARGILSGGDDWGGGGGGGFGGGGFSGGGGSFGGGGASGGW